MVVTVPLLVMVPVMVRTPVTEIVPLFVVVPVEIVIAPGKLTFAEAFIVLLFVMVIVPVGEYVPDPSMVVADPLNANVAVDPVTLPLFVKLPVFTMALVFASRTPPTFIVIPAVVVVATNVTVCPLLMVIVSVICGVVLLQPVQVAAALKFPV